jgi:hypothetical protein
MTWFMLGEGHTFRLMQLHAWVIIQRSATQMPGECCKALPGMVSRHAANGLPAPTQPCGGDHARRRSGDGGYTSMHCWTIQLECVYEEYDVWTH